jgi:HAD superfamily hydrolase (TIGR01490 family)
MASRIQIRRGRPHAAVPPTPMGDPVGDPTTDPAIDPAGDPAGGQPTGLPAGQPGGWAAAEVDVAPTRPTDLGAAAFFDVDNTMMRGASIYYLARGLAARKYFTTGDLLRFGLQQLRFRLMASEHAGDVSSARDAALAFVADWRVDDLERLSQEIFDELMAVRIWSGTRALAQLHLDAGQRVWLVTAAPVELGRVIAQRLGLTGAVGTVAEVRDGRYTGRLVGDLMHGPAKAAAINGLATLEGLDLARCAAYSDSINDIPMLSAVGHAVAVNPDAALRAEARRRGWEIRDFRTGRKAAKVAVPAAMGTAVAAGAVVAGVALARRRRGTHERHLIASLLSR